MTVIVMKIERNKGGATSNELRAYALPGQGFDPDAAISCSLDQRFDGRYLIAAVGMTKAGQRASYPYVIRKRSQRLEPTDQQGAEHFLAGMRQA